MTSREFDSMAWGSSTQSDIENPRLKKLKQQLENQFQICSICGTMYGTGIPPADCIICSDERNFGGLKLPGPWGTHSEMKTVSDLTIAEVEKNLLAITYSPKNQRCFLILNPQANVLWGCTSYLTEDIKEFISFQGGIRAIAISHPHQISSCTLWAAMFNSPVYIHERDKKLIVYNSEYFETWNGEEFSFSTGMKLIRLGGHYDGGSILYWPKRSETSRDIEGVVFCADMLQVGPNRQSLSIMRSYKNFIPLSADDANRIKKILIGLEFDRMYAGGNNVDLLKNAKEVAISSLERYAVQMHIPPEEVEEFQALGLLCRPPSPPSESSNNLCQAFRELHSYRDLMRDYDYKNRGIESSLGSTWRTWSCDST